jgi:glycosyltransferase involved in cell wall biosynthesis
MSKVVAMVCNSAWSMYNFRLGVIKALQEQGYQVAVVAPQDKFSKKLEMQGCSVYNINIENKGTNPVKDLRTIYDFYTLYRQIKPDLIFHYTIKPNIYGTLAAKALGIPSIAVTTGLGYVFLQDNLISKLVKQMYKFSFFHAEKVWFLNKDDQSIFLKENIIKEEKAFILPGEGVNTKEFKPIAKKRTKGPRRFKFLLIARMLRDKGVEEFVKAAEIVKRTHDNVEFQLLGFLDVKSPGAISREEMDGWVKEGVVNYLGVTDDVTGYIQDADCIVLPSYYREGIPRTLMEAASMGKPLITTDNVGCREVVDDEINGFLCEVKNPQDLAQKCEMMIGLSPGKRKKMGNSGRRKMIAEFDEQIIIKLYFDTVRLLLNREDTIK